MEAHGHDHPAPAVPFTPAQIEALHTEDRMAATYVFLLMVGIFVIGVGLYTYVWIWVAGA